MNYLLDTNIIIVYSKDGAVARRIEEEYKLFTTKNSLAVSIVTIAEINSLVHQQGIAGKRRENLNRILENIYKIDISYADILQKYEEIDAFSQCKHQRLVSNFTPKNMGKNDLWIAATAAALNVPLVTTDKDFNHLTPSFIALILVDINKYKLL